MALQAIQQGRYFGRVAPEQKDFQEKFKLLAFDSEEVMDFYLEVLPDNSKNLIGSLGRAVFLKSFYLAGGTGLALQLGHRISGDFDFFYQGRFDEARLIQNLSDIGQFRLEGKSEETVIGILDGVKVSFLGYKYPLLYRPGIAEKLAVANVIDIACMKIDAIASRGAKRDFIDVYFVAKEVAPLRKILGFFRKKYASIGYNAAHIKKGLVYFDDAEDEPVPMMLKEADWEEIKSFFRSEIRKL